MAENLPEPASRKEQYLATIAGMTGIDLPEPASRIEEYLNAIAQNGGGGGGGVEVVQTTGQSTTAVMSQKAVTDALNSASGAISLTEDDYNATDSNGDPCLYLGELDAGSYVIKTDSGSLYFIGSPTDEPRSDIGGLIFVTEWDNPWNPGDHNKAVYIMATDGQLRLFQYYKNSGDWEPAGSSVYATYGDVTGIVNNYVGDLPETPTSATYGRAGGIYRQVTDIYDEQTGDWLGQNAEWWLCESVTHNQSTGDDTYNWIKYSDFTGATAQQAGKAGLVPAPTTADVDKFLKGDGTWASAGGGGTTPTLLTYEDITPIATGGAAIDLSQLPTGKYIINQSSFQGPGSFLPIFCFSNITNIEEITSNIGSATIDWAITDLAYPQSANATLNIEVENYNSSSQTLVFVTMTATGGEILASGSAILCQPVLKPGYRFCAIGSPGWVQTHCSPILIDAYSKSSVLGMKDEIIARCAPVDFSGGFAGQPSQGELYDYEGEPGTIGVWMRDVSGQDARMEYAQYMCLGLHHRPENPSLEGFIWVKTFQGQSN